MSDFKPFEGEADVLTVGNLAVENRLDRVTLQGDVELTKDRRGLALARRLKAVLDATVKALEADKALPEAVEVEKPQSVKNPFGSE
jgi:hypothetical protein